MSAEDLISVGEIKIPGDITPLSSFSGETAREQTVTQLQDFVNGFEGDLVGQIILQRILARHTPPRPAVLITSEHTELS